MIIGAIDPGPHRSGYVALKCRDGTDTGTYPLAAGVAENEELLESLRYWRRLWPARLADVLVLEQVECYGMPVGKDVFESVFWSGRFAEAAERRGIAFALMPRRSVKLYLCGNMRAKDANVRQALIDRWGGKEEAIGQKRNPGPLYGVNSHAWSALALAVTFWNLEAPRIEVALRKAARGRT